MSLRPEHIVNLRGKPVPLWAGVLDLAHTAGLTHLSVTVVQIPHADNGYEAIVRARAEFADGRVFEDIGDASPKNTSAQLAPAVLRLASTRAKGRVLRDAVNIGETLAEEMGPDVDALAPPPFPEVARRPIATTTGTSSQLRVAPPTPNPQFPTPALPDPFDAIPAMHVASAPGAEKCDKCGKSLTKNDLTASAANAKFLDGKALCMTHIAERRQSSIV